LGSPVDIYCQGSQPPSGITPIGNAELLVNNPPIYSYAYGTDGLTKTGTLDIEKGTILKISSNPICQEGSFYWLACIGSECNYMPESVNQQTYLRPTTRQAHEISPAQSDNVPACPGTLPSRLSVGINAEVTTSGMAPQLSLRAQPNMSAEKAHVIAAGRDLVILDGPVCADNSYWWYIRSEQGFEGWAREGDNEDYWIDPLP
jgi:Bacterial SH3 domain